MANKYIFALNELHYGLGGEPQTIAAETVGLLSEELFNEFKGLNAVREATEDEIAVAKARGIVDTSAPADAAPTKTAKSAKTDAQTDPLA